MVQTRLHKHSLSKKEQAVAGIASRTSVRDPIDEFQDVYGSRAASAAFRQQIGSDFSRSGQIQQPIQAKPSFRGLSQELAPIQAKLTVGPANDKYEQEADRVAAQVVQRIHAPVSNSSIQGESVQRKEEEDELQLKPIAPIQRKDMSAGGEVSTDLESEINRARGGGQALAPELRAKMGEAMGADFSGVRVHTDGRADALNQSVGARAFTTGQDLFFKRGEYQPGSRGGQELIAHELTHVVQQSRATIQRQLNKEMYKTLSDENAGDLRPEYSEFCDLLFQDQELMNQVLSGESINDYLMRRIYNKYNAATRASELKSTIDAKKEGNATEKDYIKEIATRLSKIRSISSDVSIQGSEKSVSNILEMVSTYMVLDAKKDESKAIIARSIMSEAQRFLYTEVNNDLSAIYRVYANLTYDQALVATQKLIEQKDVVLSFKMSGLMSLGSRADSFVVYCATRKGAEDIAWLINGDIGKDIKKERPAMTEQVTVSSGIGIGAEPAQVATGLKPASGYEQYVTSMEVRKRQIAELGTEPDEENDFDAWLKWADASRDIPKVDPDVELLAALSPETVSRQSFGTIRSEIIASAVLHYRENHDLVNELGIEEVDLFKRFVKMGIEGWRQYLEPEV